MDSYLLLKLLHILAAVVVTGTGAGIAFFLFMANRSKNSEALAVTTRHVVLADWLFTAPAVVIQLLTGILLMQRLGYSFSSEWFYCVMGLYVFIGACWLPVLRIQYKLRSLAELSARNDNIYPELKKLMRVWAGLGAAAFSAILIIFWLMVFKPFSVV